MKRWMWPLPVTLGPVILGMTALGMPDRLAAQSSESPAESPALLETPWTAGLALGPTWRAKRDEQWVDIIGTPIIGHENVLLGSLDLVVMNQATRELTAVVGLSDGKTTTVALDRLHWTSSGALKLPGIDEGYLDGMPAYKPDLHERIDLLATVQQTIDRQADAPPAD